MKLKIIIQILLPFCFISCVAQDKISQKNKYVPQAIELNNKAMDIYNNSSEEKDSILKSLNLLNQAIEVDSMYYMAYANKAALLCDLKNYGEAIKTLTKILTINPNLVELKTYEGFLLEKSGDVLSASAIYKSAIDDYTEKLKLDTANVSFMINKAFLYFFTDSYERAIKEFKIISGHYPDNFAVKNMSDAFMSFNRKSFIDNICSNNYSGNISY